MACEKINKTYKVIKHKQNITNNEISKLIDNNNTKTEIVENIRQTKKLITIIVEKF